MSEVAEALHRDFQEILDSGISHAALAMELLQQKGWVSSVIVPLVSEAILAGRLEAPSFRPQAS